MGYKAESLSRLYNQGLPTLDYIILSQPDYSILLEWSKKHSAFGVRADYPYPKDGLLFVTTRMVSAFISIHEKMIEAYQKDPLTSFVVSEALDHEQGTDSNIVCFMDGDVLYGEASYNKITLREAWIKGDVVPFEIDNSVGDYIRNTGLKDSTIKALREIRRLVIGTSRLYEITPLKNGRLIFWQDSEHNNTAWCHKELCHG